MKLLFIDLETQSTLDLRKVGVDRYSHSASVLMLAWAVNNAPPDIWLPSESELPSELRQLLESPQYFKVAWNAFFERSVIRHQLDIDIPIEQWIDPSTFAKYATLPAALGPASDFLGLGDKAKDKEGKRLIQKFSKLHKRRKSQETYFTDWHDKKHAEDWLQFQQYCKRDVEAERAILNRRKPAFLLSATESKVWLLSELINQRGLPVSRTYVESAHQTVRGERTRLEAELNQLTGLRNANSLAQFLPWLVKRGYPYQSLDKEHVARALSNNNSLTTDAIKALELRQTLSLSSIKKLDSLLDRIQDGRVRNSYRYYGAHTGRWSGAGVQPQNFPRAPSRWGEIDIDLRACFQAPDGYKLVVADYGQIETRVLGWLTGSKALISIFDQGLDPYISFAATWFGKPYESISKEERQIAKSAVLGCGYQLSGGDLRRDCCFRLSNADRAEELSQEPCTCKHPGDEYKGGLWGYSEKMGFPMSYDEAHDAVRAYRNEYFDVVDFWQDIEKSAIEAVVGGQTQTCYNITLGACPERLLWIRLPSQRRLHYIRPRIKEGKFGKPELLHSSYTIKGWRNTKLYGGRLTENLVQAIARDVLAEGMLRADRVGLHVVGHSHDEILCEEPDNGKDQLNELIAQMTTDIPWARGLKLAAEGYESKVYRK